MMSGRQQVGRGFLALLMSVGGERRMCGETVGEYRDGGETTAARSRSNRVSLNPSSCSPTIACARHG